MRLINGAVLLLGVLAVGHMACADCPPGVVPIELATVGWTSTQAVGPHQLAATDGLIVVEGRGTTGSGLQLFRSLGSSWAFDRVIDCPGGVDAIAVNGDTLAVSSFSNVSSGLQATVTLRKRQPTTGEWSITATQVVTRASQMALDSSTLVVSTHWDAVQCFPILADGSLGAPQRLIDPAGDPFGDYFGEYSVAIDGDLLAITSLGDHEAGPYIGAVYVYHRINGVWTMVQKIMPDGDAIRPGFGIDTAMHNGNLAIGCVHAGRLPADPNPISFGNGYVRVYHWNGTAFELVSHLTHPRFAASTPAAFGNSVAMHGGRLVVGAFQDNFSGVNSGAGYVFDLVGNGWVSRGAVGLSSGAGDWLGASVAITDSAVIANAPFRQQGRVAVGVFSDCTLPPAVGATPTCIPGIGGLISYVLAWFQQDPWTDYDRDGTVTIGDLFAFLNAWMAGC